MRLDDLKRAVIRAWLPLLFCVGAGALAGLGGALMAPASYVSTARSTVSAGATEGRVEALYQVTQAIRVMMPQYTSWSRSDEVMGTAHAASGIPRSVITGVETATTPDSSVIQWTMEGTDPEAVQQMLNAALKAFSERVAASSPTADGKPVVTVKIDAAASPGERHALLPVPLAVALGAALGFVGWFLYAMRRSGQDRRAYDAEEVERTLDTTVIGQLSPDAASQTRAWDYVAAFVHDRATPGNVLLLGASRPPSPVEIERLERALDRQGPTDYPVRAGLLGDETTARKVGDAHAIVLLLERGREDLIALRPEAHSIRTLCRGPVGVLLDDRH